MYKGGRPRDNIWQHFVEVVVGGKVFAKCKICANQQLPKANRLKQHHQRCSDASKDATVSQHKESSTQQPPISLKRGRSASPPPKRQAVSVPATSIQPSIESNVVKTSPSFTSAMDLQLAKFFYACNLPFNIADHPEFIKTVTMLRLGYAPPTRRAIGGNLLDSVHENMHSVMKQALDGKPATLVQVEDKSFFMDSVDTGSMSKTAENCKKLCEDSINTAKVEFNCTVQSIVTDNARNMEKMRQALHEEDNSLVVFGCSAHLLNLLGEDITPASIMKHIKEVNKYFRNHHKPCAWLAENKDSVKPQLPGDTRWKSQLTCLDTFIKNRSICMQIVQDHEEEFNRPILQKIQDYNLFRNARDLAEQLRPIAIAIDQCQSDSNSIADACNTWIQLTENPLLTPHKAALMKRFNQAITDAHLTAYKLHPRYKGEKLSAEQNDSVNSWLVSCDPAHIATLISLQAQTAPFP
jgi:hypothetical protein